MTTDAFADPAAIARYAEGPPRLVPGFADMQRMAGVLLAETVPPQGAVLVLGAGGGLEIAALAAAYPGWRFTGVDPSAAMLDIARQTLAERLPRADLVLGTITQAPMGPFDGATCILTMPFIGPDDRLPTLKAIRARLKPGAAFVMVHHSFPRGAAEDALHMGRFAAFAGLSSIAFDAARQSDILSRLTILPPDVEEALLHEAGFTNITPFYTALAFRGWCAAA